MILFISLTLIRFIPFFHSFMIISFHSLKNSQTKCNSSSFWGSWLLIISIVSGNATPDLKLDKVNEVLSFLVLISKASFISYRLELRISGMAYGLSFHFRHNVLSSCGYMKSLFRFRPFLVF